MLQPPSGLTGRQGLYRQPDILGNRIVFVSGEILWSATIGEGEPASPEIATQLTPKGQLVSFPRLSPDGKWVAYTGNLDVWLVSLEGGEGPNQLPRRRQLTFHPAEDRVLSWYPDSQAILISSNRQSAFPDQYRQLYKVHLEFDSSGNLTGGPVEKLPLAYGEYGAISPDGKMLALQAFETDNQLWNRYRGGLAPDIYLCNLSKPTEIVHLTTSPATDSHPQWITNDTLVFLSDWYSDSRRDGVNLWLLDDVYNEQRRYPRRLTDFDDFGLRSFAVGSTHEGKIRIVIEKDGELHCGTLRNGNLAHLVKLQIGLPVSAFDLQPRPKKCDLQSPAAGLNEVYFEGRGRLWHCDLTGRCRRVLEQADGALRYPSIDPTGRFLAYYSDQSGEYDLYIHDLQADRSVFEMALGAGFRYPASWSPSGRHLAFVDNQHRLCWVSLEAEESVAPVTVDRLPATVHPDLESFPFSWIGDRLLYSRAVATSNHALFLFDTQGQGTLYQLSSGQFNDRLPCASQYDGAIYCVSRRTFAVLVGEVGFGWIHANTQQVLRVPLEVVEKAIQSAHRSPYPSNEPVNLSPVVEPAFAPTAVTRGRFTGLAALPMGGLLVHRAAFQGDVAANSTANDRMPLDYYPDPSDPRAHELESPTAKTRIHEDVVRFSRQDAGSFTLVEARQGGRFFYFRFDGPKWAPGSLLPIDLKPPEALVSPTTEWRQILRDAWRLARDYFYLPRERQDRFLNRWTAKFERLMSSDPVARVSTRTELNRIISWLFAELESSHTAVQSLEHILLGVADQSDGLLGADLSWQSLPAGRQGLRVDRILEASLGEKVFYASPLAFPSEGEPVAVGDLIIAVDGQPVSASDSIWSLLAANEPNIYKLTIENGSQQRREITIGSLTWQLEKLLRLRAWIEFNRGFVERVTGGLVGYLGIPGTTGDAFSHFTEQFQAQYRREGLIFDGRFNGGGQFPVAFLDLIGRPRTAIFDSRFTEVETDPVLSRSGAQLLLVNPWAGSGGDFLPYLFRRQGLGLVIGTRTWGGTVGSTGAPDLIDGGKLLIPNFAFRDPTGSVELENRGFQPDQNVSDGLSEIAEGVDLQLEAGIRQVLYELLNPQSPDYSRRLDVLAAARESFVRHGENDLIATLDRCLPLVSSRPVVYPNEGRGLAAHGQFSDSTKGKKALSGRSMSAAKIAKPSSPLNRLWR